MGGERYMLEFIYEDNAFKPDTAVTAAYKLIEQDEVLAIVGPDGSSQAIPAGGVAEENGVPLISPWSTNPNTTLDRPYVFRACFLDPFQAPVAVKVRRGTVRRRYLRRSVQPGIRLFQNSCRIV